MNIFSLIGFISAIGVLVVGTTLISDTPIIFIDYPSMFIVLGGTFAATAMAFQLDRISLLIKIFLTHITGGRRINFQSIIKDILVISEAYRNGESIDGLSGKAKDYFLKESLELIADGVLERNKILDVLENRAKNVSYLRSEDAQKIKTIGKFPPAFGMMGTTMGMVVLLANLAGEDALQMIGPAMAVCLITTLYGVIVANLFFIPIGEHLTESTKEMHIKNLIIIEGVKHIIDKTNPIIMAEELNSFLLPKDRLDWKKVLG